MEPQIILEYPKEKEFKIIFHFKSDLDSEFEKSPEFKNWMERINFFHKESMVLFDSDLDIHILEK